MAEKDKEKESDRGRKREGRESVYMCVSVCERKRGMKKESVAVGYHQQHI